jgi:hypothetical protein
VAVVIHGSSVVEGEWNSRLHPTKAAPGWTFDRLRSNVKRSLELWKNLRCGAVFCIFANRWFGYNAISQINSLGK